MQEAIYASLASNLGMWWGSDGKAMARTGNQHGGLAESPYNVYPTKDGYIAIICVGEQHWKSLIDAMQRPELRDDPRFADLRKRVENMAAVDTLSLDPGNSKDFKTHYTWLPLGRWGIENIANLDKVLRP